MKRRNQELIQELIKIGYALVNATTMEEINELGTKLNEYEKELNS